MLTTGMITLIIVNYALILLLSIVNGGDWL